jgi:integrase
VIEAYAQPTRFRDVRDTFAGRLAASGQPLRTIQEFLGHADSKTTQIYAHSEHDVRDRPQAACFAAGACATPEAESCVPRR